MFTEVDLDIVEKLKYSEIKGQTKKANMNKALVIIFSENYKKGLVQLNVVAVKLINDEK